MSFFETIGVKTVLVIGTVLRVCLILYGEWQDRTQIVKYTDVDYYVFTDAAEFMTKGQSPYLRPTYRYTPLLAWLLQPNITLTPLFGKIIFIFCDIITGYLIYLLCISQKVQEKVAVICSCLWLLNPVPATVSSRGNAESIMAVLVLLSLKLVQENKVVLAAVIYATSVHVKIYPAVYALQIYLYLKPESFKVGSGNSVSKLTDDLWPNKRKCIFVCVAGGTFLALTGTFYYWYGWDFLHETYLYHLTRRDIRHNFSVYFYMLYLTMVTEHTLVIGLLSFIPQLILMVTFSIKYRQETALCWFLNTFVFVTFNKVCTSQYFLWYLSILPVVIPKLYMSYSKATTAAICWISSQGFWLLFAYYLEFEGQPTFLYIWIAGVLFFLVNIWIMAIIIESYKPNHISHVKKIK
ncbi:phosphatidylinositol glycan, class M [Mytilus galloprovincialis]|uniref:GPI alpha-1,4-mannosyltransferase I, catalytic subunit n=2 Tax=Mytilus galloprovincialis TaxID=29158 RepID=A0A8B6BJ67_MYTGA|nr:phosphatidylinositol glycan, class M [Mytilus galloprovincialis]